MGRFTDQVKSKAGARKQMDQGRISVRLVEFAQPLIDGIIEEAGTEPTEEQLRRVLMIAVTIWNAQIMEQIGKGSKYADEVRQRLNSSPEFPGANGLFQSMLERKAKAFPDDLRYIGKFDVYKDAAGELRVQAEARLDAAPRDEH